MNGFASIDLVWLMMASVFSYAVYVKVFKKLGQTERKEGVASHQKKNGTITMGGILFIVLPLFFIPMTPACRLIVWVVLAFGILGVIDDVKIILLKKNDGLSPTMKLLFEVLLSGLVFYLYLKEDLPTSLSLFSFSLELKWFYGLLILWLLTASANAWNLMDGIDGLCSGCSLLIGIGLMVIAVSKQKWDVFYLLLCFQLVLFVFWCFNLPKAFLFMGDVGSLALGGMYAMTSLYLDCLGPFIIMSGLFIFETLSVILQVFYFKRTKGKRLFKMAPFHHHLELCHFPEIGIDLLFYLIQFFLIFLGWMAYF